MFHSTPKSAIITLALVLALTSATGCQKKGEEVPLEMPQERVEMEEAPMPAVPTKIIVPDDVAAKFKAVILEVVDKDSNDRGSHTVPIGDTALLGNTGLTIYVEAFLPSFQMSGDVFTSSSPDLNNPAAKVRITDESGTVLYDRWLFALYPATHPFEHPRYSVTLKDQVENK